MRGCFKIAFIATGLVLIAIAASAIFLFMQADVYSRSALEYALQYALGVDLKLGRIAVSPLRQHLDAYEVIVGNPSGFPPGPAIEIQRIGIDFNAATFFSKTPVIRRLLMQGTHFNLHHQIGHGTNLGLLAKQFGGTEGQANRKGRSFILQELRCEDAYMRLSSNVVPIGSAGISIAPFTVSDLGDHPVSVGDIAAIFLRSVLRETLTLKGLLNPVIHSMREESAPAPSGANP